MHENTKQKFYWTTYNAAVTGLMSDPQVAADPVLVDKLADQAAEKALERLDLQNKLTPENRVNRNYLLCDDDCPNFSQPRFPSP